MGKAAAQMEDRVEGKAEKVQGRARVSAGSSGENRTSVPACFHPVALNRAKPAVLSIILAAGSLEMILFV